MSALRLKTRRVTPQLPVVQADIVCVQQCLRNLLPHGSARFKLDFRSFRLRQPFRPPFSKPGNAEECRDPCTAIAVPFAFPSVEYPAI